MPCQGQEVNYDLEGLKYGGFILEELGYRRVLSRGDALFILWQYRAISDFEYFGYMEVSYWGNIVK